jgi:hypothetical protein
LCAVCLLPGWLSIPVWSLMFGLWIEEVAPCFITHDNPVQNACISISSVNHVCANEGSFFMLVLCDILWKKVPTLMLHSKVIMQNSKACAMWHWSFWWLCHSFICGLLMSYHWHLFCGSFFSVCQPSLKCQSICKLHPGLWSCPCRLSGLCCLWQYLA